MQHFQNAVTRGAFTDHLLYSGSKLGFAHCALRWLSTFKLDTVKNSTFYNNYESSIRVHLIPHFRDKRISAITTSDIQEYFNEKRDELSLETLAKHKGCLSSIFEVAVDDGLRKKTPVTKRIRLSSTIPPAEKFAWTLEQYKIAWQFAKRHQHGLDIMVLMETGMTRSELLGLTWTDHDHKNAVLRLEDGLTLCKNPHTGQAELVHDKLKNKHRKREIPLSKELNGCLYLKPKTTSIAAGSITTKHIFHAPKGGPYSPDNWYKRVLKNFMKDLHEEYPDVNMLTTHELRHTRATLLVHHGKVDLFSIAELLGHGDLKMIRERYVHPDTESLRRALGF